MRRFIKLSRFAAWAASLGLLCACSGADIYETARTTAATRTTCPEEAFATSFASPSRYTQGALQEDFPEVRRFVFKGCETYMVVRCEGTDAEGVPACRLVEWVREDDSKLARHFKERLMRVP